MDALGGETTVRCTATLPTGEFCRNILWKVAGECIVASHALRGGGRFTQALPLHAAQETQYPCTRCWNRYWPAALDRAQLIVGEEVALAVMAKRPADELDLIIAHNSCVHADEPWPTR